MINLKTLGVDVSGAFADKAAGRYLRYVYERERSLKWLDPLFYGGSTLADYAYKGLPAQPYADPETLFYSLRLRNNSLRMVDLPFFLSGLISYLHHPKHFYENEGWGGLLPKGFEYLDPVDLDPFTPERLLARMGITEKQFFRGQSRPQTIQECYDRSAGYFIGGPRYNADALDLLVRLMRAETVFKVGLGSHQQHDPEVYGQDTWRHRIAFDGTQTSGDVSGKTYIYSGIYENIRRTDGTQSHYWSQGGEVYALRSHWDYTAVLTVEALGDGFHSLGTNLAQGRNYFRVPKSGNLHPIVSGGTPEAVRLMERPDRTYGQPAPANPYEQTRRTSGFCVTELVLDFRGSFDFLT